MTVLGEDELLLIKRNLSKDYLKDLILIFLSITIIYYFISNYLTTDSGILLKNDYIDQHIPFYEEFYRLLNNGLPFWSWNAYLGTNFWGSKIYYLVGDVYAWIGYLYYLIIHNVVSVLNGLFFLKFFVGYIGFYIYLKSLGLKRRTAFIFSLFYIFMGWNTTFIEHPVYTSIFSLMPFLFIGIEQFLHSKKIVVLVISVFLLVSMNFYLFWTISLMVLVYWIIRYIIVHDKFIFNKFMIDSLKLLGFYVLAVVMASVLLIPALLHIIQSDRLGSLQLNFDQWQSLNIASFITFTLIPRLNYFADGVFKDFWYYFHQVSIYFGLFSFLLIPHSFYIFKAKKERLIYGGLVLLLPLLLVSPKIGLFFHFTYSLRYTLMISFFGLIISAQILDRLKELKWSIILLSQVLITCLVLIVQFYFVPLVYGSDLPAILIELDLLNKVHWLSLVYTIGLLITYFMNRNKNYKFDIDKISYIFIILILIELQVFIPQVFVSQQETRELNYYIDTDYQAAVNFLKEYDHNFYRIENNQSPFKSYENISLVDNYHSLTAYDSVYQYSLSDFLNYFRQYPVVNWSFRFTEPTFYNLVTGKYIIVDPSLDMSLAGNYYTEAVDGGSFGKYQIYKYKNVDYSAFTYSKIASIDVLNEFTKGDQYNQFEVADMMLNNLYVPNDTYEKFKYLNNSNVEFTGFNTSDYGQNYINYYIDLNQDSMVFFSIPYDKGWEISIDGSSVDYFNVQGGFIGVFLEAGTYTLQFNYVTPGFYMGLIISVLASVTFIIISIEKKRSDNTSKLD